LTELLEHGVLIRLSDADPGVADRDLHAPLHREGPNFDPPALRGNLDRIRTSKKEESDTWSSDGTVIGVVPGL
jgi:hypothetical protein